MAPTARSRCCNRAWTRNCATATWSTCAKASSDRTEGRAAMNISQFMTVLRARKKLALTWFFSLVVLSVVVTLIWPDHFRGDALVVVDTRPDPISGLIAEYGQTPSIVATQLDIINSDRVARRVVRDLNLTR